MEYLDHLLRSHFEVITWVIAIASTVGVILNIKKSSVCFYIWAVTNASWTVIDFIKEIYAQSALFFLYFLLALWGVYEWHIKDKR